MKGNVQRVRIVDLNPWNPPASLRPAQIHELEVAPTEALT